MSPLSAYDRVLIELDHARDAYDTAVSANVPTPIRLVRLQDYEATALRASTIANAVDSALARATLAM